MAKKTLKNLKFLTQKLRSETGCPWDRKQTIESMLKCLIDETQEVKEAVEKKDYKNLEEELGDVLFQIVMIAEIAKEEKYFDMDGVVEEIYKKIVSRHTWVFGKDKAHTPEEAIAKWQENKKKEKNNSK
ncbi:nucleotide pyrophosphohydrolase [Candidatus Gracilibacteria bacterium]|jgi:MazG family protein|nr:nucleotide pyrophosphohydrolase [Candidatus Gracilibacteria bacterium]